ncbi:hypothetical protein ASZ78_000340 [Callipepla squamata]|uniref:Immunoglobulin domain-containing protein n=1 Tax=Callipepla squamata TaxID=9009 RepID=A0A226MBX8_CALSU|nr:hypothetical protein ASZ78_000340 [Callipepla squamata]
MAVVLIFVPRPSLSLHPSYGVAVGGNVTLRCHVPRVAAWVWLYQDGGWTYKKYKEEERDAAEFSFVRTVWDHAGAYQCRYRVSRPLGTSELSDPAELVLTDRSLPPPGIALSSEGRVGTGSNVTIRCWNKPHGAAFLLHKDGRSAPVQRQDPDVGGTAAFTLFGVTPADGGTYRCSYRLWGRPFLSSPLGDNVTLEVTPTPAPPGAPPEKPEAAGFQVKNPHQRTPHPDLTASGPPRDPTESPTPCPWGPPDPMVPPADDEGLTYIELNIATPSTQPPNLPAAPQPHVIYAEVAAVGQR